MFNFRFKIFIFFAVVFGAYAPNCFAADDDVSGIVSYSQTIESIEDNTTPPILPPPPTPEPEPEEEPEPVEVVIPTPTPSPRPTATPTPVPTPCPSGTKRECSNQLSQASFANCQCVKVAGECKYYTGEVNGNIFEAPSYLKNMIDYKKRSAGAKAPLPQNLSCIKNIANFCGNPNFEIGMSSSNSGVTIDPRFKNLIKTNPDIARGDDCVAAWMMSLHTKDYGKDLYTYIKNAEYRKQKVLTSTISHGHSGITLCNTICREQGSECFKQCVAEKVSKRGSSKVVFDKNCNAIENYNESEICGDLVLWFVGSPISLIWEENTNIDDNISIVQFPLDLEKNASFYTWKASKNTPLLVYDPEHKGNINSPSQLFGNWTFGGKQVASLSSLMSTTSKWENGFEALSTLDLNQDGKVSDEELKDLALWFDINQDGVSQNGEVKALSSLNLTALYYNADYKDPLTGDLHAKLGFTREINGKTINGASVDWYGAAANNINEALARINMLYPPSKVPPKSIEEKTFSVETVPTGKNNVSSNLTGAWKWSIVADETKEIEEKTFGLLNIEEIDGKIYGTSLLELPLNQNEMDYATVAKVFTFEGERKPLKDGSSIIEIEGRSDDTIISGHILQNSNSEIIGHNTSQIFFKLDGVERSSKIKYSWKAKKLY